MARFIRCIEGHVYDAEQHASCPRCVPAEANAAESGAGPSATEVAATPSPPDRSSTRRPILMVVSLCVAIVAGYWMFHQRQSGREQENVPAIAKLPQPPAAPVAVATTGPGSLPAKPAPSQVTAPAPTRNPASNTSASTLPMNQHPAEPSRQTDAIPTTPDQATPSRQAALDQPPRGSPSHEEIFDGPSAEKLLRDIEQGGEIGAGVTSIARLALGAGFTDQRRPDIGNPLIERAARDGVASAAATLAHGYLTGSFGLPKDPRKALPWAEFAAARGEPNANFDLVTLKDDGSTAGRSAARGHFLASYLAAYPAAMEIARKAKQGDGEAAGLFRDLELNPSGLPPTLAFLYSTEGRKNPAQLRQQLAAYPKSVGVASYFLATMMWNGQGGTQDRRAALPLFFYAAECGYTSGLIYVAAGMLDGTTGQTLPYSAAILLVIAQMSTEPPSISGLSLTNLYSQAQAQLPAGQLDIVRRFEMEIRRFAKPGSVFASRKN